MALLEIIQASKRFGALPAVDRQSLQGGLAFEAYTHVFTRNRDNLPLPGEEYVVEFQCTLFETDLPTQHFWSPRSGRHYRILWSQTFRETIR